MRIEFKGMFPNGEKLIKAIEQVIYGVLDNADLDGAFTEGTFALENVQFNVVFSEDGGNPQYISVPREIEGKQCYEVLCIRAELDENGDIKDSVNNEEDSFHSLTELELMAGVEHKYTAIESDYVEDQLTLVDQMSDTEKELKVSVFKIAESNDYLRQYFHDGVLVFEERYKQQQ
ncbi:hypothetical protein [Clostridium felsineum]|uniref:hypothetical protein n=1 Tax=Clostridium felsineum TaxID=36839 RepID=UPI00098C8AA8|nr:hypothetical protein [Clostridium felsineum]URZ16884.1 hypothetical protein CLFE_029310 [Clostridium felsineum DSM 794]